MVPNRPSSPTVVDQDLQQLYDQVLAGFRTEGSQSPTATTVESASTSYVSPHPSTSYSNPPNLGARPPRNGSSREHRAQESASGEDISRIYSVYASDNGSNEYRSPVSASSYHHHHQNNDPYDNNYDNQSMSTMSPISPVSSAAATYARSTRSASFRSNGRDGTGGERRLPSPPTHTQGHLSTTSISSINSTASSRRLPATPASATVSPGRERAALGVGLPVNPRLQPSPSPTRDKRERAGRLGHADVPPYLTADYLPTERE